MTSGSVLAKANPVFERSKDPATRVPLTTRELAKFERPALYARTQRYI